MSGPVYKNIQNRSNLFSASCETRLEEVEVDLPLRRPKSLTNSIYPNRRKDWMVVARVVLKVSFNRNGKSPAPETLLLLLIYFCALIVILIVVVNIDTHLSGKLSHLNMTAIYGS